ncbi:TonB-dependent receptor [Prevotella sp. PINT]|jgi:TonB-linked outer membrane protein, SusC/RagA family/TonB-dependent outer membrane receptor, SusC/RagA subfamily, signature region|uniref:SusC/RagA family TonB-linked outer membrane protein n=1 Tax=Palleniella intestinalis TaxID=2736291 RepID=UPI0015558D93|nr:TonB-dependent receptor [Palleniella intestinalis]NPD81503.1 TonB-dependent receptor [Palleniella intestinalis]
MKKERFLISLLVFFVSITAFAQKQNFSGTVVDNLGEPVIGASVVLKGSSNGTITDVDGKFTVNVEKDAELEVSFVGYATQRVKASQGMRIVLHEDNALLDEVVVVGYGVQKKSVVTASIAKVSAEDLAGKSPVRMDNALKGLAAGVNVTSSSGQPGAAPKVRIRGTGTINNSDPLYIVDGMPIEGGLDFLNPSDIESIEVLKDAASGAIYGARAANGVILVTTKKGKMGKAAINYNFSYGWQSAAKRRDVTNATDYAILQNEFYVNGGQNAIYADPYNLKDINGDAVVGGGTDWQDLVFNDNAPVVNHEVSISGASEKINYYLSLGYYDQEGIVGGNYGQSNYNRLSMRSNTNYTILDASKERNFLNKIDLNVSLAYTRIKNTGISENTEWGSVLGSALYMSPILPLSVTKKEVIEGMETASAGYELIRDAYGNPYTVPNYFGAYQEINNPIGIMSKPAQQNWSHKFVPKFAFDVQLWGNLKYHFSYSADLAFWGNESYNATKWYLSGNNKADHTGASKRSDKGTTWQVENTLTYDKTFGKHSFSVVLGQSAFKSKSDYLGGNRYDLVNPNKPSIDYATGNIDYSYMTDANGNFVLDDDGKKIITGASALFGVYGGNNVVHTLSSYFGRVSYNYDERYMFQGTLRRDGSSRFGSNNKYGVFPSFSVGWNVMNEMFMEKTRSWLSNMKFRFSWGKNGSDAIGDFRYTVLTSMGNNVLFGKDAIKFNGSKASGLPNANLKWEESVQTDIGIDLGFMNNALTFTADYYVKKTSGMLMTMPIPSYVGETKPIGNVGDMKNSGFEFELGYKWHVADAIFSVKANATYLKNELTKLGEANGYIDVDGVHGINGGGTRGIVGQPFPFFFGYKTDGIIQNVAERDAYINDVLKGDLANFTLGSNLAPGDVKFVDVDGNGIIDTNDRTNIGNGTPDWTFGINLNAAWKGFDFNLFMQGVTGADVFDGTYRTDIYAGNYPTWMLGRWTGEGTSNKYPILKAGDTQNWLMSDLYVCDGSYWRIKNISIGYTLPQNITRKFFIDRLRVYVQADNLVTWTKYWGFDPEISSGATSLGVDRGVYPQARTWTIGVNVSF